MAAMAEMSTRQKQTRRKRRGERESEGEGRAGYIRAGLGAAPDQPLANHVRWAARERRSLSQARSPGTPAHKKRVAPAGSRLLLLLFVSVSLRLPPSSASPPSIHSSLLSASLHLPVSPLLRLCSSPPPPHFRRHGSQSPKDSPEVDRVQDGEEGRRQEDHGRRLGRAQEEQAQDAQGDVRQLHLQG